MLKRIVIALAGLLATLALAVAPASGAQNQLLMYPDINEGGTAVPVETVPQDCTVTPLSEVKSADNNLATDAAFHFTSDCSDSPIIAEAGGDPVNTVVGGSGAIRYKANE